MCCNCCLHTHVYCIQYVCIHVCPQGDKVDFKCMLLTYIFSTISFTFIAITRGLTSPCVIELNYTMFTDSAAAMSLF